MKLADLKKKGIGSSYEAANKRRLNTFHTRKASVGNIRAYFSQRMMAEDQGMPGPSTKQDDQMLRGMLTMFRRNGIEDHEVFAFVRDLVHYWSELRGMETITLKGKQWVLNVRPSLRDITICRESLMSNLLTVKNSKARERVAIERHEEPDQGDSFDAPEPVRRKKKKPLRPTQADIDAEYERLQDE
jgi:hypothetical protein